MKIIDIIVVGCGPAGMTAALYIARAGKSVLVLDKEGIGGQMAKSPWIENFPGIEPMSGLDLAMCMYDQIEQLGVQVEIDAVCSITPTDGNQFMVTTELTQYLTRSLILASGAAPISLNVPGGTAYDGDGVYYCAVCDGPLFHNRDVLVIGSGNTGAQYALEMQTYCKHVAICDIAPTLFCEQLLARKIQDSNIEIHLSEKVTSIAKDDNQAEGKMIVTFQSGLSLSVDGVFVAIGQRPATDYLTTTDLVALDVRGYIISENLTTNIPGIFTAGDCRTKQVRQAVTAAGDGATAAVLALRYLQNQ